MTKKIGMSSNLRMVVKLLVILIIIIMTITVATGSIDSTDKQITNPTKKGVLDAYCGTECNACPTNDCGSCKLPEYLQYKDDNGNTIEELKCSEVGEEYKETTSSNSGEQTTAAK